MPTIDEMKPKKNPNVKVSMFIDKKEWETLRKILKNVNKQAKEDEGRLTVTGVVSHLIREFNEKNGKKYL